MYRLADASLAASSPQPMPPMPITPVSPVMQGKLPTEPLPSANSNTNANTEADEKADIHVNANPNSSTSTNANVNTNYNYNSNTSVDVNDDTIMFGPMDASTWPWLAPLNWNDILIDGSHQNSNLHSIVDPQTDPGAVVWDDVPNFVRSISSPNSEVSSSARGRPLSPTRRLNEHDHYSGKDGFDINSNSNSNIEIDRNGPEFGVAQLSQLSSRLYPLYRSSCNLAEAVASSCQSRDRNYSHQSPLIDDVAFKSVTAWLVDVSANMNFSSQDSLQSPSPETTTMGNILHNAFSASHRLLEILQGIKVDVQNGTSYNSFTASTSTTASTEGVGNRDFWESSTPQSLESTASENLPCFELNNGPLNHVRRPSQCCSTVVRHLVIACNTLLLNIHAAVLIVLQHDVDLRSSSLPHKYVEANADMDVAALADIRLVLVLRLCSYLIKRQHQAVDLYLSPQLLPVSSQENGPFIFDQPGIDANREAMSDLEVEVQQRLERLQQTLHI
ncbi:hypothetical protein V501_02415 [Pseudogymnoascus sp. VKM F-4519 (FW-2642)]|nr:hypothetical protein V501_02415 [Pseudogymnoascus sp. VKM F-4519 (FW-2642)]